MVKYCKVVPCLCAWKGSSSKVRKCRRTIIAENGMTQYQKRKQSPSYLWSMFKTQAGRHEIEVTLKKKQYVKLIKKPCKYFSGHKEGSKWNGSGRIDSDGPYSPDNTVACCAVCNYMKGSLSVDEFLRHAFLIVSEALKNKVGETTFSIIKE